MLVDSIYKNYFAEMDYTGKICLIGSDVYYLYTPEEKEQKIEGEIEKFKSPWQSSGKNSFQRLDPCEYEIDTVINRRYHIVCTFKKLYFFDLEGEHNSWSLLDSDHNIERGVLGFFPDGKYLLTIREGERGAQYGIDVIDLLSGVVVYHINPNCYVKRIYYNAETEQFAFGDEESQFTDTLIDFPTFDHLVSLCRKATQGMVLSDNVRRKFYLNTKYKK